MNFSSAFFRQASSLKAHRGLKKIICVYCLCFEEKNIYNKLISYILTALSIMVIIVSFIDRTTEPFFPVTLGSAQGLLSYAQLYNGYILLLFLLILVARVNKQETPPQIYQQTSSITQHTFYKINDLQFFIKLT